MNKPQPRLMYRLFPLLLVCVCFVSGVQAQDSPSTYQLVEPSAKDYIEKVNAIISNAIGFYSQPVDRWAEPDALTDEIRWRLYDQQQITYQQLLALYRSYQADTKSVSIQSIQRDTELLPMLIEAYLTEQQVDLKTAWMLNFDAFMFNVRNWSYSNMGLRGAYSLTLLATPYWAGPTDPDPRFTNTRTNFIVLEVEKNSYLFPSLPILIDDGIIEAGDLNADSQPDFAYIHYTHWGNNYISGDLHIVTWTGDKMESLTKVNFFHGPSFSETNQPVTWQFVELDNDTERELKKSQILYDNWDCTFVRVSYYDWQDDATLKNDGGTDTFPESFNCLLRRADEAMWEENYSEAVKLYERASVQPDYDPALMPYTNMRLGLAYLLNGQSEQAQQKFSNLTPFENNEQTEWAYEVREAYLHDPRLLAVCQAVYNQATEIHDPSGITGAVYITDGGFYGPDSYRPETDLEKLSCDLPTVLALQLAMTEFSTDQTPVAQLEALGLVIGDSITANFDSDSKNEWIVWIDSIGIDPMLFAPDMSLYRVTVLDGLGHGDIYNPVPDLRLPDPDNQYWITRLPDGTQALVNVDFGYDRYADWECGGMCGGGPDIRCIEPDPNRRRSVGDIGFWRLENGQLRTFFFSPVCKWMTPEQMFPGGEGSSELHTEDSFPIDEWNEEVRPRVYQWDENERTFVAPPQPPQPTLIPSDSSSLPPPVSSVSIPQPEYDISYYTLTQVRAAFSQRDFMVTLEMLDAALGQESQDQALIMALRYYRGLTLEALNRPDEALEDYIAIYEANPETAWGLLAGLHLQVNP